MWVYKYNVRLIMPLNEDQPSRADMKGAMHRSSTEITGAFSDISKSLHDILYDIEAGKLQALTNKADLSLKIKNVISTVSALDTQVTSTIGSIAGVMLGQRKDLLDARSDITEKHNHEAEKIKAIRASLARTKSKRSRL